MNTHFFLFEKGELSEKKFRFPTFSGNALAGGVLNIGDFFKG